MSNDHLRVELLRTVLSGDREPRELLLTAVLHLCCLCERCKIQLEAVSRELDPDQTLECVPGELRYLAEELILTFQELNVQREAQIASTLLEQAIALEGRPIVH